MLLDDLDLSSITDERMRTVIVRLLNIIADQATALREAQAEIQRLRDDINRLKMRDDIKRTPIFGLGCVAGAAGLARASTSSRPIESLALIGS